MSSFLVLDLLKIWQKQQRLSLSCVCTCACVRVWACACVCLCVHTYTFAYYLRELIKLLKVHHRVQIPKSEPQGF